ncbi:MAG: hypothetical protein U1B94_07450, partial [candidate division NC10 bacterium]|nr:hypothetical protein [candidate division NC10 bacterium]
PLRAASPCASLPKNHPVRDDISTRNPVSSEKLRSEIMPRFHEHIKVRMREALGCRTDAELAAKLGRRPGPISQWRSRGNIPKHAIELAAAISGRSVSWILTGEDKTETAGRLVVSEPEADYGLIALARRSPDVVPWMHGLAQIIISGDEEKAASIKGNIQAFLEALGRPRVQEARASPGRRKRKAVS